MYNLFVISRSIGMAHICDNTYIEVDEKKKN